MTKSGLIIFPGFIQWHSRVLKHSSVSVFLPHHPCYVNGILPQGHSMAATVPTITYLVLPHGEDPYTGKGKSPSVSLLTREEDVLRGCSLRSHLPGCFAYPCYTHHSEGSGCA